MPPASRQTNLNAFHSYLHTTQLSAPSHPLLTKTSAFQPHPIVATTYSSLHLLLPSDAATTSATFLFELNYATNHKTTYSPEALFNAASILLRAPKYPTGLLQLWKLYLHNSLQMLSQSKYRRIKKTTKKIALTNAADHLTSPPTYSNLQWHVTHSIRTCLLQLR